MSWGTKASKTTTVRNIKLLKLYFYLRCLLIYLSVIKDQGSFDNLILLILYYKNKLLIIIYITKSLMKDAESKNLPFSRPWRLAAPVVTWPQKEEGNYYTRWCYLKNKIVIAHEILGDN